MTAVALLLLALGVSDAVAAGLPGHPPRRVALGPAVGTLLAALAGMLLGVPTVALTLWSVAVLVVVSGWTYLRAGDDLAVGRAWGGLSLLAVASGLALLVPLSPDPGGLLTRVLGRSEVPGLAGVDAVALVAVGGVVAALSSTSNAIVRLVLVLAGPHVLRSRGKLRGGRLIGPLERYLILGLALAGAPTAAGLVVAAKSALRFPELATTARAHAIDVPGGGQDLDPLPRVDAVTEYVLIGSLASWSLALLGVLLLR